MIRTSLKLGLAAAMSGILAAMAAGCTTNAYCFADCESGGPSNGNGGSGGKTPTGQGGAGGESVLIGSSSGNGSGSGGGEICQLTNGGIETCDSVDNDCDGEVDDIIGLDLTSKTDCGLCGNNCNVKLSNCDLGSITCDPGPDPGNEPGTCTCNACVTDYYDLDNNGTCEYYCVKSADDDASCNNKDDDCDNLKDEDVDLCTSTDNCGKCGAQCVVLHGEPKCVHTGSDSCGPSNTKCAIKECTCTADDCWWDLDGLPGTGCEYECYKTNGGIEKCGDGIDNDCDGRIDSADDLSGDPVIDAPCYGDPDGECAKPDHAGKYACVGNEVVCAGDDVLREGMMPETCNLKDDDCDGEVDDNPAGVGDPCGTHNLAPCKFGKQVCVGDELICSGAVGPQPEACDGIDNDCDGTPDFTVATSMPPADSVGACNVPKPPPTGATSPCKAGTKACIGGVIACQGSVGPSSQSDGCGVDANCDNLLTNQPNLQSDVLNCGVCGKSCYAGAVHASWSCKLGVCTFGGCESGYYDINGDQKCEYACNSNPPERCNGFDDDCDGAVDEDVIGVPSPVQECDVSPSSISPECTTGVTVACQNGAWKCIFPTGVCNPTCADATEVCDALDNDCDGAINENVPTYGKPCASDDAAPTPGDGACRTTGTFICDGTDAVTCNAVKKNCNDLPGGCTEKCDGIDNDCDGTIDEPFTAKGTNTANFVKPAVTKISDSPATWIFAYEASRPNATDVTPGSGNGYHSVAPAGAPLDKTLACSVPTKIPWFNVSPVEVEQTCTALGGKACGNPTWKTACQASAGCAWGYDPNDAACLSSFVSGSKFCNLGVSYSAANGQDALLVTMSPELKKCSADWSGLLGNAPLSDKLYDITGNLREVTRCQRDRAVCASVNDAATCSASCCSGTSTAAPTGGVRLCGNLTASQNLRLSGQACTTDTMCCNKDSDCTGAGFCKADASGSLTYCMNAPGTGTSCRARGVACTLSTQCCGGNSCVSGVCGGPEAIPHSIYPLMGGSFLTQTEGGARCDFSFYNVEETFKFFDTGFRCCFASDPTQ